MPSIKPSRLHRRRGQTTVEFALAGTVLFILLIGILEVARLVYGLSALTTAARDAARYGIASSNPAPSGYVTACVTSAGLTSVAQQDAGGVAFSSVTATTTNMNGSANNNQTASNPPAICTVTVTWAYSPASGLFGFLNSTTYTSISTQYFNNNLH